MMTVITRVKLNDGAESEWDEAMQERLKAAPGQQGWIGGQLLVPEEGKNQRVIVGTWESRGDWKSWHEDEAFQETRKRLEGLQQGPDEMEWFEIVKDARD